MRLDPPVRYCRRGKRRERVEIYRHDGASVGSVGSVEVAAIIYRRASKEEEK